MLKVKGLSLPITISLSVILHLREPSVRFAYSNLPLGRFSRVSKPCFDFPRHPIKLRHSYLIEHDIKTKVESLRSERQVLIRDLRPKNKGDVSLQQVCTPK